MSAKNFMSKIYHSIPNFQAERFYTRQQENFTVPIGIQFEKPSKNIRCQVDEKFSLGRCLGNKFTIKSFPVVKLAYDSKSPCETKQQTFLLGFKQYLNKFSIIFGCCINLLLDIKLVLRAIEYYLGQAQDYYYLINSKKV